MLPFLSLAVATPTLTWAAASSSFNMSEDYESFDSIVRGLSRSRSAPAVDLRPQDPLEQVQFHGGVALATTLVQVQTQGLPFSTALLRGVEASLGIDLFTPRWVAEGALRSFAEERAQKDLYVSLKEFDLKFVHRIPKSTHSHYRFGAGLSARYLDMSQKSADRTLRQEFNTPAALVFLGGHTVISRHLSAGAEVSYRAPLVGETADKGGASASLRLDSQF